MTPINLNKSSLLYKYTQLCATFERDVSDSCRLARALIAVTFLLLVMAAIGLVLAVPVTNAVAWGVAMIVTGQWLTPAGPALALFVGIGAIIGAVLVFMLSEWFENTSPDQSPARSAIKSVSEKVCVKINVVDDQKEIE